MSTPINWLGQPTSQGTHCWRYYDAYFIGKSGNRWPFWVEEFRPAGSNEEDSFYINNGWLYQLTKIMIITYMIENDNPKKEVLFANTWWKEGE